MQDILIVMGLGTAINHHSFSSKQILDLLNKKPHLNCLLDWTKKLWIYVKRSREDNLKEGRMGPHLKFLNNYVITGNEEPILNRLNLQSSNVNVIAGRSFFPKFKFMYTWALQA